MSMRYAAQEDNNQPSIVEELRRMGFDVDLVFRLKGLYDLVVSGVARWSTGRTVAVRVEVKREGGSLTPDEKTYWERQRNKDNLIIATCAEDILKWFGLL
jgi:hypothetical protein